MCLYFFPNFFHFFVVSNHSHFLVAVFLLFLFSSQTMTVVECALFRSLLTSQNERAHSISIPFYLLLLRIRLIYVQTHRMFAQIKTNLAKGAHVARSHTHNLSSISFSLSLPLSFTHSVLLNAQDKKKHITKKRVSARDDCWLYYLDGNLRLSICLGKRARDRARECVCACACACAKWLRYAYTYRK